MNPEFFAVANSPILYGMVAVIIAFVMAMAIYFLVKSYREGIRIGMDKATLRRVVISSASFTVVPSIGILLGVIALSGALGVPVPWLRLSVIGALHYEAMAADVAASAMKLPALSAEYMTPSALVTITFVMTIGIIWGAVFSVIALKKYQAKVLGKVATEEKSDNRWGNILFNAMFIGMICAFIGTGFSDLRNGSFLSLAVIVISGIFMAFFTWVSKRKYFKWVESFALSFSMLLGMTAAVLFSYWGWIK